MNAFVPSDISVVCQAFILFLVVIMVGYLITKIKAIKTLRILEWVFALICIASIVQITAGQGAGFRMNAIILISLLAVKVVVTGEAQFYSKSKLSFAQWFFFSTAWVGMRPSIFAETSGKPMSGGYELILFGAKRVVLGALVIASCGFINKYLHLDNLVFYYLISLFLLIGLSLILHFGLLNICAGVWRLLNVDARTLFRSPLLSKSLEEFWGKRWNIAFSEMVSFAVFRPLSTVTTKNNALIAAFLFSGLLHELAISVPVNAGYGLPMCYFLIQGGLLVLEKFLKSKGIPIYTKAWVGRTWTIFWLIVPLPILFHPTFLEKIVWPLIGQ